MKKINVLSILLLSAFSLNAGDVQADVIRVATVATVLTIARQADVAQQTARQVLPKKTEQPKQNSRRFEKNPRSGKDGFPKGGANRGFYGARK